MNWVLSSLIAAVSFSIMILLYRKLLLLGINSTILNFFIFGFTLIGFTIVIFATKTQMSVSGTMIILLIIASLFALAGNYLQVTAYKDAPNPGYVNTLVSTQLVLITVFSVFLYKSDFTWIKFFGIIFVLIGAYLVGR